MNCSCAKRQQRVCYCPEGNETPCQVGCVIVEAGNVSKEKQIIEELFKMLTDQYGLLDRMQDDLDTVNSEVKDVEDSNIVREFPDEAPGYEYHVELQQRRGQMLLSLVGLDPWLTAESEDVNDPSGLFQLDAVDPGRYRLRVEAPARAEKTVKSKSKRRATDRRENFDADRIAALLNKVPDAGSRAASAPRPDPESSEPARGVAEGRDQTLSRSEIDALRARISQCWNPPVGGMGADRIRVKLRLRLNADGSLTRAPQVVNREASPFFQSVAERFEEFERVYPDRYQRPYGFWRPIIRASIEKFLKCGDLKEGFARVRCPDCGHEFFVAFS